MKISDILLGTIFKNKRRYEKLKSDDEKCLTSNTLGIRSVFSTVAGTVMAVLCVWTIAWLFEKSNSPDSLEAILIIIGIFLLAVLLAMLLVQLIANGLVCAVLQMKLNKKPIGLVSLILWLVVIVVAIIIIAVVIF